MILDRKTEDRYIVSESLQTTANGCRTSIDEK